MTGRTGWGYGTDRIRLLYSRHLRGAGIELGPGHHPYVLTLPLTQIGPFLAGLMPTPREAAPEPLDG